MKSNYILFEEEQGEEAFCDFGEYVFGTDCDKLPTVALVDTTDKHDHHYPEGFHEGHFCAEHGKFVLEYDD